MTSYLLHGFWGEAKDWNAVLRGLPLGVHVQIPDLYESGPLAPDKPLQNWVEEFWKWVEDDQIQLVGYSMGARLALNAILHSPRRVARALLLSCNPVLPREEWPARMAWEAQWQQDFKTQPWSELEQRWQGQEVFTGSPSAPRRHSDEMRIRLGQSLENWSVRHHTFSLAMLREVSPGVDWAFGASDHKYLKLARALKELPVNGQVHVVPQVGHRLLLEAPDFVSQWMTQIRDTDFGGCK